MCLVWRAVYWSNLRGWRCIVVLWVVYNLLYSTFGIWIRNTNHQSVTFLFVLFSDNFNVRSNRFLLLLSKRFIRIRLLIWRFCRNILRWSWGLLNWIILRPLILIRFIMRRISIGLRRIILWLLNFWGKKLGSRSWTLLLNWRKRSLGRIFLTRWRGERWRSLFLFTSSWNKERDRCTWRSLILRTNRWSTGKNF